jgi:Zn-finger nucleic acid-binding protein
MKCPHCTTIALVSQTVEGSLQLWECTLCEGHYLPSAEYFRWLEQQGENLPEVAADDSEPLTLQETKRGKLCPDCGAILVPYKVGRDTGFSLDRCGQCGGIWFEKNEWATLRARNLHDDIHLIFAKPWQDEVRQRELAKMREARLRQTFGDADYDELMRIKTWLDARPKSQEMYSFLLSERRLLS